MSKLHSHSRPNLRTDLIYSLIWFTILKASFIYVNVATLKWMIRKCLLNIDWILYEFSVMLIDPPWLFRG